MDALRAYDAYLCELIAEALNRAERYQPNGEPWTPEALRAALAEDGVLPSQTVPASDAALLQRLGAALEEAERVCEEGYARAVERGDEAAAHDWARARELLEELHRAGGWAPWGRGRAPR